MYTSIIHKRNWGHEEGSWFNYEIMVFFFSKLIELIARKKYVVGNEWHE